MALISKPGVGTAELQKIFIIWGRSCGTTQRLCWQTLPSIWKPSTGTSAVLYGAELRAPISSRRNGYLEKIQTWLAPPPSSADTRRSSGWPMMSSILTRLPWFVSLSSVVAASAAAASQLRHDNLQDITNNLLLTVVLAKGTTWIYLVCCPCTFSCTSVILSYMRFSFSYSDW